MERLTATTIDKLQPGSIFYKAGDANKRKLLLLHYDAEHRRYIIVDASVEPNLRSKEFLQRWLKAGTAVVFLRIEEPIQNTAI